MTFAVDPIERARLWDKMNLHEEAVAPYLLPDPLLGADGKIAASPEEWAASRRPELLRSFQTEIYGVMPPAPEHMDVELLEQSFDALGGTAERRQLRIHFGVPGARRCFLDLLLYLPKNRPGRAPLFLGLNFCGNQSCVDEPEILISEAPIAHPARPAYFSEEKADESLRGCFTKRWCVRELIDQGFALATAHYAQLFSDRPDGFGGSIYRIFESDAALNAAGKNFGAIGAWAWGLSRIVDVLEQESGVDPAKIAVIGHSRLGKTALWAAAVDPRFALAISNDSGAGGASLWRRNFGENLDWLLFWRDYWFTAKISDYLGRENEMPVDQHELLALIAPRPLYVASATEDDYADPVGEFLSLRGAGEVYRLWNKQLRFPEAMPEPDRAWMDGALGYHIRKGPHAITPLDWGFYRKFAEANKFLRSAE